MSGKRIIPAVPVIPDIRSRKASPFASPPFPGNPGGSTPESGSTQYTAGVDRSAVVSAAGSVHRDHLPPSPDINQLHSKAKGKMKVTYHDEAGSGGKDTDFRFTLAAEKVAADGIQYVLDNGTLYLTCDTSAFFDLPSTNPHHIVADLVGLRNFPRKVTLYALTGPRLNGINKVPKWLEDTLGPKISSIEQMTICVLRPGEWVGDRWAIPELDLPHFEPLAVFIRELTQMMSFYRAVKIDWGLTTMDEEGLKEDYHCKADKTFLEAHAHLDDAGKDAYSEVISSETMQKIANVESTVTVPSMLNPLAQPFHPLQHMNPAAPTFVPAPWSIPLPIYDSTLVPMQMQQVETSQNYLPLLPITMTGYGNPNKGKKKWYGKKNKAKFASSGPAYAPTHGRGMWEEASLMSW
ncbi:uncharacterized protein BDR25DRAFT_386871 [Lindgomyces ingoldianus]|uniref:Uncharacterized protein n=1 Tax=Lindgomyces ingoldianus TaxID=673940 RepID=A0ACB6R4D3_9PLEO|nr:uncharacterized protein BDR25DRAFT_386871 [Lindgomyces ingoldianus]KAF2473955.1 hypothetical protein BDR25DRAFT_386871 [Lindgomyces ingoldianus]